MINGFGFNLKNWFTEEFNAQNNGNTLIEEKTTKTETEKENQKGERFSISIKEMQMISNALIVYSKHLNRKENESKATEALSLEDRIYQYLTKHNQKIIA